MKNMKVAIVHDWLTGMRGGEKVLEAICEIFPQADLFTLIWKKDSTHPTIEGRKVKTSLLQKMPLSQKKYRYYLPLMPLFAELFNLSEYDLVISSSHAVAKNVRTGKKTLHISYIHSPMRYVWDMFDHYFGDKESFSWPIRAAAKTMRPFLQKWDVYTTRRVDHFVVNSSFVGDRVKNYYQREHSVIHPPVSVDEFIPQTEVKKENHFIIISALVPYKKVDLAIKAFNQLGQKLIIVGDGTETAKLKLLAKDNIHFAGYLEKSELIKLLQKARAFIYPQIEDFGITAIESQAAGTPVVAYRKGGALETIKENQTGLFFDHQTEDSLIEALERFERKAWNVDDLIENARRFDRKVFKENFEKYLQEKVNQWKKEGR